MTSDFRTLARSLTLVENDLPAGKQLLLTLTPDRSVPVIGFTGAPGAGKSTLINALAMALTAAGKKLAILAVDPTSPFTSGSLLGDRIRMPGAFPAGAVFIRSLATRGALGGMSLKAFELADVLRASGFDYVFVETVGVGQSEVEIAGLADLTVLVLVPGAGDEVQLIKSGIMEIADVFVINKSDLPGAAALTSSVKKVIAHERDARVVETSAINETGIAELAGVILQTGPGDNARKSRLLAERAWKLVEAARMADIDKEAFRQEIEVAAQRHDFNIYRFADRFVRRL